MSLKRTSVKSNKQKPGHHSLQKALPRVQVERKGVMIAGRLERPLASPYLPAWYIQMVLLIWSRRFALPEQSMMKPTQDFARLF